jgi:hypothetical protein
MKRHFVVVALVANLFIFGDRLFAKPAGCPCSPCKCSPCTCGGGKGKHHHDHEGARVGGGANIDLGGVGQRKGEPDPFATSGGSTTARTEEKPKTKRHEHDVVGSDPFTNVSLTGQQAKGDTKPPGPINVSDPPKQATPTDKDQTANPSDNLKKASAAYKEAQKTARQADPNYKGLSIKAFGSDPKVDHTKAKAKFVKLVKKIDEQFDQSDEGKKLHADWVKAYEDSLKTGEKVADDLVPSTSDEIENKKFALAQAQVALNEKRATYEAWKKQVLTENAGVKSIQAEIDKLKAKTHFSDEEAKPDRDQIKKLQGDLDNAKKQTEKDFAESKFATDQMKQVQKAEQDLDKAKEAYKPYEQLEKAPAKAASNP